MYAQISNFEAGFSGPSEATMLGREGAAPGQHASVSAKKVSAWLNSSVGRDEIMPEFIRLPIDVVAIGATPMSLATKQAGTGA